MSDPIYTVNPQRVGLGVTSIYVRAVHDGISGSFDSGISSPIESHG